MYTSDAATYATYAHGDQKYGKLPYVMHLAEVVSVLVRDFEIDSTDMIKAAWLHDVIEDTDVDYTKVAATFGYAVANIVDCVTDPDLPTRKARKAQFVRKMSDITADETVRIKALIVKLADRVANIRAGIREGSSKLEMYVKEDEAFRTLFTDGFLAAPAASRAVGIYEKVLADAKAVLAS